MWEFLHFFGETQRIGIPAAKLPPTLVSDSFLANLLTYVIVNFGWVTMIDNVRCGFVKRAAKARHEWQRIQSSEVAWLRIEDVAVKTTWHDHTYLRTRCQLFDSRRPLDSICRPGSIIQVAFSNLTYLSIAALFISDEVQLYSRGTNALYTCLLWIPFVLDRLL